MQMWERNQLFNEDCLEGMKRLPDNCVDLVLTSPPYDNIEGSGYSKAQKDILFLKTYSDFLNKALEEVHRVLKPTGHFFLNMKHSTLNKKLYTCHWIEFLEGFKKFEMKSYIIWKYSGSFDSTFKRYHLDYEIFYHLAKSDDISFNINGEKDPLTSVWYIPHAIPKEDRIHPVQMPEAVAEKIIRQCTNKGDLVLDIFGGSGTSLVVAKKMERNYVGFELNPSHYENALKRLMKTKGENNS